MPTTTSTATSRSRSRSREDQRKSILSVYDDYTATFQSAYERFSADPAAAPDASAALPFYHAPCMFITPAGIALFTTPEELARHFEQVMLDMQAKRYLRTGLGTPQLTTLGKTCALLSLEITRFDRDEMQYDQYGVTYTFHRDTDRWRVAVVTTHPKHAVITAHAAGNSH